LDINYEILYAFIMASMALAIAPGPDNIYVLLQSVVNGRKYGMATVAGLMTGCFVHTSLVAFGVSVLIKQSDTIFFIIKLFGALYLFFLAYKVFKSTASLKLDAGSVTQFYVLGILFVITGIIVFGAIAFLAGSISEYLKRNAKIGVFLKWTQIIVFIGIGIFILFSEK